MPIKIDPTRERSSFEGGCKLVAGIDEVGVGAMAGPLVACCAIFDERILGPDGEGAIDSKRIKNRSIMQDSSRHLRALSRGYAIGWVLPEEIEHLGDASRLAMFRAATRAFERFGTPDIVYADHHEIDINGVRVVGLDKADNKIRAAAAASIIAKSFRDRFMERLSKEFPGYTWEKNAGYFVPTHKQGILERGPNRWHRMKYLEGKKLTE